MLPRIIFCIAVLLATLAVILLALFSPVPQRKPSKNNARSWLAFSLYIQQAQITSPPHLVALPEAAGALIFHRTLTEGPENTSRVVGKAQGFIIPIEHFAHSAFNIIYLTFHTDEYSGSLGVQARNLDHHKDKQELTVVGGTGSFAYARGLAVFVQTENQASNLDAAYPIKLHLKFPDRPQTIAG